MKLYTEVLIESVEQAEALPEDTPVLIKVDGEAFGLEFARDLLPEHMTPVHHTRHYALVPIEAEEDILKRVVKEAIREERVEYTQAQNRRAIDEEFLRSGVMLQALQGRRRS